MHPSLSAFKASGSSSLRDPSDATSLADPAFDAVEPASGTHSPASILSELLDSDTPHDPHALPNFSSTTLTRPSEPILYLPPLISSLPHPYPKHLPAATPSAGKSPLATETRLPDIDPASLSLHKALHNFGPITDKYAEVSYADAFNWDELELSEDEEREWYCVASDPAQNPYWKRDVRRAYPQLSVVTQSELSTLLIQHASLPSYVSTTALVTMIPIMLILSSCLPCALRDDSLSIHLCLL